MLLCCCLATFMASCESFSASGRHERLVFIVTSNSILHSGRHRIKLHTKPSDSSKQRTMQDCHLHTDYRFSGTLAIMVSAFTEIQNSSQGEQNVFLIYLVPPLCSPCTYCLWSMLKLWEGDRKTMVKAMKMEQTRCEEVWQKYKMKMALKVPLVVWQRLPATYDSLQETYSLNAPTQALWALMGTYVQTKGKSLIFSS